MQWRIPTLISSMTPKAHNTAVDRSTEAKKAKDPSTVFPPV
jgi:hypothetical protein